MRPKSGRISYFTRKDEAMRTRPRCIGLWLSDAEHEHLANQCAVTGLNANALIRKLIMGENLRPRPPDTYAALLRELSAIGNNVNQLAHQANAGRHRPWYRRRGGWCGRRCSWPTIRSSPSGPGWTTVWAMC